MADRTERARVSHGVSIVRVFVCLACAACLVHLSGCASTSGGRSAKPSAEALLERAQNWQTQATRGQSERFQAEAWMHCATLAHYAMAAEKVATETAAGLLATQCSRAY